MRRIARGFLLILPLFSAWSAAAQLINEEIDVRVVNVDVVVTDRSGQRISGLRRENFQLFEDGKPVEIAYFSRYADGRMELDRPPGVDSTESPAATPDAASVRAPLTWVIFIDQTSMPVSRRNLALGQLRAFLERAIGTGDRGMLATSDGQSFRVRQNVTTDRTMLLNALSAAEKDRVHQGRHATEAGAIRRDLTRADPADRNFVYLARELSQRISFLMEQEARRTHNTIAAMGALLDVITRVEGRIALLYIGGGFDTLPSSDLADAWRQAFSHVELTWTETPRPEEHQDALEAEVSLLLNRLSASRITLYSIHPGEAMLVTSDDPGFVQMEPTVEGFRATEGEIVGGRGEIRQTSIAREMAARTGGVSFRVNPALARQLEVVRKDVNDYYSLGYIPQGPPTATRRVRVQVNVAGARVRHRDSVRERSRWEDAGYDLVAALVEPPRMIVPQPLRASARVPAAIRDEANPLQVSIEPEQPQRAARGREHVLPFRFNMNLDALTFVRGQRSHRADLIFHFALAGPDGTLWPIESREQSLEIPHGEVPANTDQVNYAWHLDLAPLRIPPSVPIRSQKMRLTVSVVDRTSGVRSVVSVDVPRG